MQIRKHILVPLGTTVVLTIFVEIGLRLFYPASFPRTVHASDAAEERFLLHVASDVPGLPYELAPNFLLKNNEFGIRTNSHGMRDAEPRALDPSRSSIVAAVGDSFTYGHKVGDGEPWPQCLERELDALGLNDGRACDVLNFGVSGYGIEDISKRLEHHALPWKPDLVIIGYYLNDPENLPIQPLQAYYREYEWWERSHAARWLEILQRRKELGNYGGGDYHRFLHENPGTWNGVLRAFEEMARATQDTGAEALLVIFPLPPSGPWKDYPYFEIHEQVAEAGRADGLHVIDLLPTFRRTRPRDLKVTRLDSHPSPRAHAIAARVIAAYLESHPQLLIRADEDL